MTYRSLAVGVLAALCLSACGGGGGGRSEPPGMDVSRPAPRTPDRPTAAEAIDQIGDIRRAADRLISTDIIAPPTSSLYSGRRTNTTCRGATCNVGSLSFSVDTLNDLSGATVTVTADLHGVHHGRARYRTSMGTVTTDVRTYGGWIEKQFFSVIHETASGTREGLRVDGLEAVSGLSVGNESGSNPMSGSATWDGLMVGLHQDRPTEEVTGSTKATYSFADQTMDVEMTNLTRGHADMSWEDLRVSQGRFSAGSDADSITGSFYGDAHEEVGGVFERNSLIGAFGAKRK